MRLELLLSALPLLYWPHGVETAAALRQAGIERVGVPPDRAEAWRQAGFAVVIATPAEIDARERLTAPGIAAQADTVSATRSPWILANGWRFLRGRQGTFLYDLPAGPGALAAAEAFVYGADALLKIDPSDVEEVGAMLVFLGRLPALELPAVADFGVVDDGSPLLGEVMNLLVRRNLLFAVLDAPSPRFRINVRVGTKEYTRKEAADPSAFALRIRRELTDEERTLRVYGTECVIARLGADGARARLHLLNYGGRDIEGLRIRLRGAFPEGEAFVAGRGRAPLEEHVVANGATEFSLPRMGPYAVVDLRAGR